MRVYAIAGCSVTGTPETLSCGPFNLAAGESKVLTYTVIAVDDGQFLNQASISVGPVTKGPAIETVVVQNSCKKYEFSGNAIVPFDCGDGYKAKPGAGGSLTPDKNTCCVRASYVLQKGLAYCFAPAYMG